MQGSSYPDQVSYLTFRLGEITDSAPRGPGLVGGGWSMATLERRADSSEMCCLKQAVPALFVDLVSGGEQFARHREAKPLGGLYVDDKLKSSRLQDGQVAR